MAAPRPKRTVPVSKRPHIVIFNPDQFRTDGLAHAGNPCALTPNLAVR